MSGSNPKWGRGSDILTSAHQRRKAKSVNADDGWDGDFGPPPNDNDAVDSGEYEAAVDNNPFESIGRALDQREEDAKRIDVAESLKKKRSRSSNTNTTVSYSPTKNIDELPMEGSMGFDDNTMKRDGANDVEHLKSGVLSMELDLQHDITHHLPASSGRRTLNDDETPAQRKVANHLLPQPSVNNASIAKYQQPKIEHGGLFSRASKRRRGSSVMKKSPQRFTFQSSAKPKGSNNTFKTPSSHKSLPSRSLFPSSTISQKTTNAKSTQSRKRRHTFRQSTDRASNTTPASAVNNSNIRSMGVAPTFLSQKSQKSPEDAPADDEDDFDSQRRSSSVSTRNIVSEHHQQQQAQRKAESSNAKSGYLVKQMHSLRSKDQAMAMRLRSGQYYSSGVHGGSAFMSRRQRRSSGNPGGNNDYSSTLDVTVSAASLSDSNNGSVLGDGRAALLAYIHRYTVTKPPAGQSDLCNSTAIPCFSWIVMSHDVMREQGIENGCTKQMRLYDAVVIPPRAVCTNRSAAASNEPMPTIICTHVCQEYPAEQPLLQAVSFEQFD